MPITTALHIFIAENASTPNKKVKMGRFYKAFNNHKVILIDPYSVIVASDFYALIFRRQVSKLEWKVW